MYDEFEEEHGINRCVATLKCTKNHLSWFRRFEDIIRRYDEPSNLVAQFFDAGNRRIEWYHLRAPTATGSARNRVRKTSNSAVGISETVLFENSASDCLHVALLASIERTNQQTEAKQICRVCRYSRGWANVC